jgi:hypothetical protein
MEVVDVFGRINVVCTDPTELFIGIFVTEPLDKIPEFCPVALVKLRVNDLLDLEVLVTINVSMVAGGGSSQSGNGVRVEKHGRQDELGRAI